MEATKNWLADLKLRASWGINGNDIIDNEAPYTKYLISLKDASYNMNGDGTTLAPGGYKVRSTNPDLKWESTRQLNIGVDAAFLNGRLSASLDYLIRRQVICLWRNRILLSLARVVTAGIMVVR